MAFKYLTDEDYRFLVEHWELLPLIMRLIDRSEVMLAELKWQADEIDRLRQLLHEAQFHE